MLPENLTRQFIWTVIPTGRVETLGGQAMGIFSLLLTPRLLGPQETAWTVADFGMEAWPQLLNDARFEVLRFTTSIAAEKLPLPLLTAEGKPFSVHDQQAVWEGLFPRHLSVRPYQTTSYKDRAVESFPASEAGAQIRGAYGSYARLLARHEGKAPLERHAELQRITGEWRAGLWPETEKGLAAPDESSPLWQAYRFYHRRSLTPFTEDSPEVPDFHDVVARLADHPSLLRATGLLMDFAVPIAQLGGNGDISVTPRWPSPDRNHKDLPPRTAYTLVGSRFLPVGSIGGMLALAGAGLEGAGGDSQRFEIMPFDVDGAVLRLVSASETYHERPPFADATAAGVPSLRSVGFALVETTRKQEHERRIERARQRATTEGLLGLPLSAENLVAGYRIDIFDERTGQWRSLCQRRVRYTIGSVQIRPVPGHSEEGFVRPDSVTTGGGTHDALYVHQTVARWDGWSPVVTRPERVPDSPPTDSPFIADAEMEPGSLPRLRFGRKYSMRVRLADLAGGGLRLSQVGPGEQQSNPFTHRRFEPIPPPELAPTRAYADGEGQDQLVIRSDRGISPEDYAAAHAYRAFDLRYLLAPQASLDLAMQYEGRFDAALGPTATSSEVARLFEVARRADGGLKNVAGVSIVQGDNNSGDYFVLPETPIKLPWLPDPGSCLVAILVRSRPIDPGTGLPGEFEGFLDLTKRPKSYLWKGEWPIYSPVALRVEPAPSGCKASMVMTGDQRTLHIALGPAEQATLDIVSCPKFREVPSLGIANWAGATGAEGDEISEHISDGKNPMVTPPRTISVVHAVQRPLKDPGGRLKPERKAEETHVVLVAGPEYLNVDVPSTGRMDIRASWSDWEDIRPNEPVRTPREAVVGSYDIRHEPLYLMTEIRQEFGDTRRRRVTHRVTCVSRFSRYFERILAADPQACTVEGTLNITDVPSSVRPPAPAARYVMPAFRWSRETDGTAVIRSSRRGGCLRVLLERPWYSSGEDEMLAVLCASESASSSFGTRYLSLAGKDPIWETGAPPAVLSPSHMIAGGGPIDEFLPESGRNVKAMVYAVQFDKEADCWVADIDLSPVVTSSYFPFVRLALARYQANTVRGIPRLSSPIVLEPIQVLPHRDLAIRRSAGRASLTVSGTDMGSARPTTIQAELQVFEGNPAAAGDALIGQAGWRMIARQTGSLGRSLDLDVPQAGSRQLRLAVTETEAYPAEGAPAVGAPTRMVYSDIVPL